MKSLRCVLILAIGFSLGWAAMVQAQESPLGGLPTGGSPAPNSDGKVAKPVKPRERVVKKLPEKYKSKDKDGDGQVGLYEWPKSDYTAFRKLDRNGDGFLTALELLPPVKFGKSKAPEAGSAPIDNKVAAPAATDSKDTPAPAIAATTDAAPAGGSTGTPSTTAERMFKVTDKDGDGSISETEWKKSFSARPKFEKAMIDVQLPMSKEDFLLLYPASAASSDK